MQAEIRSDPIKRTRVVLVRHGQSTYNAEKRHQGCSDRSTLTQKGVQMAHQTGLFLQTLNADAVYSSPLKRAYQTAQQMLMTLPNGDSLPLYTSDLLQEIDLPAWEGLPYQVVRERFADDYRHWKEQPHTFQMAAQATLELATANPQPTHDPQFRSITPPPQQRFPVLDLYGRASRFWQTMIPRHRGQTLLIVSHGGAIRALISTALGLSPSRYHQWQQSNCGVSVLNFSADGNPFAHLAQLEMMNSTIHLGETLPKLKEGRQGVRLLLLPCGENSSAQAIVQVKHLLRSVPIDFSFSSDSADSEALTQILQHHSETLQHRVLGQDFAQAWQGAISKRYPQGVALHLPSKLKSDSAVAHPSPLTTGLVIAPVPLLKCFIGQALELEPGQANHLQLRQNALSVLHYPDTNRLPILQALNFSSSRNQSI